MFYSDKFKVAGDVKRKASNKEKNKELSEFYYSKDEDKLEKEVEEISEGEEKTS